MSPWLAELRWAWRRCRRRLGSSVAAVTVLALGLGLATAFHAVGRGVLWRGLPVEDPHEIVTVGEVSRPGIFTLPLDELEMLRHELETFDDLAGFYALFSHLSSDDSTRTYVTAYTTANFFDILGVAPRLGRTFEPDDARPGGPKLALISEDLWRRQLGGDPQVLGRTLKVNRDTVTVLGVMPAGFSFPFRHDLWILLDATASHLSASSDPLWVFGFGRRAEGVSLTQARAELAARPRPIRQEASSQDSSAEPPPPLVADPFTVALSDPDVVHGLRALTWAVIVLLTLATLNVAVLLLARGFERRSELALRFTLGASKIERMRPLLVESLLLAGAGGILGLGVAQLALKLFASLRTGAMLRAYWISIELDAVVLLTALGTTVAVAVLAGLLPALRTSPSVPLQTLPGVSNLGTSRRANRSRDLVLGFQVALSGALLITSALVLQGLDRLRSVDLGLDPAGIHIAQISIWQRAIPNDAVEPRLQFYRSLREGLEAHPEITTVGLTTASPAGRSHWLDTWVEALGPDDGPSPERLEIRSRHGAVDSGFFARFGIPLLAGREFESRDRFGSEPVVVVNQSFAERWGGGTEVLGQRLWLDSEDSKPRTVVGVVGDVAMGEHGLADSQMVYQPLTQGLRDIFQIVLRTDLAEGQLVPWVERAIAEIDTEATVYDFESLAARLERQRAAQRWVGALLGVFAVAALLVTSLGLFGSLSQGVRRRWRELGLRLALGARRGQLLSLLWGRALRPILLGGLISVLLGYWAVRWLAAHIEQGPEWVPLLVGAVFAVQVAVSCLALVTPSLEVTRVEPGEALRDGDRE